MTLLFGPVGPEILVVVALVVLLFGANRIPKAARSVGQSVTEFQKGKQESEEDFEDTREELKGE